MKLEDNLSAVERNLLMDLIRNNIDVDQGEAMLRKLLAMDVSSLGIDHDIAKQIAEGMAEGVIKPGFLSGLYCLVIKSHPLIKNQAVDSSVTSIFPVPESLAPPVRWSPEEKVYQLFEWLKKEFVSFDEVCARWDVGAAKQLWQYFKADRARKFGYELIVENSEVERLMLKWVGGTISQTRSETEQTKC